jgi:hypothetical protein
MARDTSDFDDFCNSLYQALRARLCTPKLEVDQTEPDSDVVRTTVVEQPGKRFFPNGTAEAVFREDKLEQLLEFVVNSEELPGTAVDISALVKTVEKRKLQPFLAALIYTRCRLHALRSFTQELVMTTT